MGQLFYRLSNFNQHIALKHFTTIIALALSVVLCLQNELRAQESSDMYTIYLVRHAEKDLTKGNRSDPPLTECGTERSKHLSTFLSHVAIDAVYSTDYVRTISTASPTAQSKELEIQEYSPGDLEEFAKLLKDRKQNALVVGHSNTTGVLAGLLADEKLSAFDESIYNRIYQVVIHNDVARLHLFHTAFECLE